MGKRVVEETFCDRCKKRLDVSANHLIMKKPGLTEGEFDLCEDCSKDFTLFIMRPGVVRFIAGKGSLTEGVLSPVSQSDDQDIEEKSESALKGVLERSRGIVESEKPAVDPFDLLHTDFWNVDPKRDLPNRLKRYLKNNSLTQLDFSKLSGLSHGTVSNICNGNCYVLRNSTIYALEKFKETMKGD